ncbi:MAG: hypothetical protein ABEJ82_06865 [Haloplanus sp.]
MDGEILDAVTEWTTRSVSDGVAGLYDLADEEFSGAVTNGTAWAFVLNGRVIGVFDGDVEDFEEASLSAYAAPDLSLPLLYAMQAGGGETRGEYYSNETPLSEVDRTLSEGNFVGYVELSENVLSGDYYVVYYGGRSLPVAYVGNSERLLTGDEAFDRAADEVGIYRVVDATVSVVDLPDRPEPDPEPSGAAAASAAVGEDVTIDATEESDATGESDAGDVDETADDGDDGPAATSPTDDAGVDAAEGDESDESADDDESAAENDAADEVVETSPFGETVDEEAGVEAVPGETDGESEAGSEETNGESESATRAEVASTETDGESESVTRAEGTDETAARLRRELETAREAKAEAESERERVAAERDELQAEVDRLRDRVEELEARIASLDDDSVPERTMDPSTALSGTNLFVRYEDKSAGTVERAAKGLVDVTEVRSNLRLDYHTEFETEGLVVDGRAFEAFLHDTTEFRFVRWLLSEPLFEIRRTDTRPQLSKLYEALPEVDRIDFDGEVSVADEAGGADTVAFDVVCRNKMGDPLFVADIDESRDPTEASAMSSLLDRARTVGESSDSLAAACGVTSSFFGADAMETAVEATRGGLFSRSNRRSYVKLSRKRGFHLCLIEARDEDFFLSVPDL